MSAEVCPYCRTAIAPEDALTVCDGCGTRHHADCYAENGGCTIFGCTCAPPEEPKLSVSAPDLAGAAAAPAPALAATAVASAPPPPGGTISPDTGVDELRRVASQVVPSMFSTFGGYDAASEPQSEAPSEPKSRTTFIVLGALLGALGAHNFYAGYTKKGVMQLLITVLTLGFASPMSWIWAIIDICTVNCDRQGVQFES